MISSKGAKAFGLTLTLAPVFAAAGHTAVAADRSVTIIEGVDEPNSNPPPPTSAAPPDSAVPPASAATPALPAPQADLATANPAGLTLSIAPSKLRLGSRIAFTVSTHRPGYLVIVDLNAEGRWTQVYPNMQSLSRTYGNVAAANLIKPDAPVTIPNLKNPLARFVFTADPPRGNGAVVAILSDRPVQIIDLPETPAEPQNPQAAVEALIQAVANLKIASADGSGTFTPGVWSFVAAPYVIE